MKKKISYVILSIISLVFALPVLAQDYGLTSASQKAGYQQNNVFTITQQIVNGALALLGMAFLGVMLYAGLRWMTARGNEEYTNKAKNALEAGAIGLIIILSAYAIANFVMKGVT